MGFVGILGKSKHDEKCLLAKNQFQTFGTETTLEGFVWSHWGITELISRPQIAMRS